MEGGSDGRPKLHILLICFPLQGHLSSMLYLARKLLALDFSITIANAEPSNQRLLQSWGAVVHLQNLPDPFGPQPSQQMVSTFINSDQEILQKSVGDLLNKLCEGKNRPSCIIFDPYMPWVLDMANNLGILSAGFWTSSALTLAFQLNIPRLIVEGCIPAKSDDATGKEITWIPGFPALKVSEFPTGLQNGDPEDPQFIYRLRRTQQIQKADWILFNTFDDLEMDSLSQFPTSFAIGPLLPATAFGTIDEPQFDEVPAAWREDKSCMRWLDTKSQNSVVYVSFGTIARLSAEQVQEVAEALQASGYPFLWAIRPDLIQGNLDKFLEDFIIRNREQGMIIPWAPQIDVLKHPSIGGFLSHCGWNSTLESICGGVPIIGWPLMAEQNLNCKFIVDVWQIGMKMPTKGDELVTRVEIEKMIGKVMKEEIIRKRVKMFGIQARKATSDLGSSYHNLNRFAEDLIRRCRSINNKSNLKG